MRHVITALLTLTALLCFAAAYRFASHGIRLNDNKCLVLAGIAVAVGGLLLWLAFRKNARRRQRVSN